MSQPLQFCAYRFDERDEYVAGVDPGRATRRILIIAPLFDEMNRTRRALVGAMRELGEHGIASFLPDLPGTNESTAKLADQDIWQWRSAVAAASEQLRATHIASVRGGALIDDVMPDAPHWRLAPAKGASLLKTMLRTRVVGDKEAGVATTSEALLAEAAQQPILLGGNWLGPSMVSQLNDAVPTQLKQLRNVSIGMEPGMIAGSALWLRAEPGDDPEMAQAIAADIDRWSVSCAA